MKRTDIRLYLYLENEAVAVDRMAAAWAARLGVRLKQTPSHVVKTVAGDPRPGLHFVGLQKEPPALAAAMVGGFVGLVVMFPCETFGPFNEAFAMRGTSLYGVARVRLTEEEQAPTCPPDRSYAQYPWGFFMKDDGDEWSIVSSENSEGMIDFLFGEMRPFRLAAAFLTVSHLTREIEIAANAAHARASNDKVTRQFVTDKLKSLDLHGKEMTNLATACLPAKDSSLRVELERINSDKRAFALTLASSLGVTKTVGLGLSRSVKSIGGHRTTRSSTPTATHRPLRVLHISDLHERAAFSSMPSKRKNLLTWDAEERGLILGSRFSESLSELTRDGIDLVCFTGDLADWGRPEEYLAAAARLDHILQIVNVPKERFFAVPGNHDVQRGIQKPAWKKLRNWHASTQRHAELGRWMRGIGESPAGKSVSRDGLLERTKAFWDWLDVFGRPDLRPTDGKFLGYRHTIPLGNLSHVDMPVHVIGLDSAWFCGDDTDQGRIILTEEQVQAHVRNGEHSLDGFRIGLVHHPLDHLADHHDVRRMLADDGVDLLLHGHQHAPIATVVDEPGARLRIIAAGCLVEGERGKGWPNGFQLIEIHPRGRKFSIHFRKWSREGRFWAKGSDLYRNAPDGVLTLREARRHR